jgi:pimeloyl-ACP methyl ester carboxylesterase
MRYLVDQVAKGDVTVLVFVHGWHHNAYANDCNVQQFRAMVRMVSDAVRVAEPRRKIVGVYVGWRGESVTLPVLRYTTIATRKIAAEHVAKGSVRELFARLKLFETRHRVSREDRRVRTIVIGHSFGGLIAFHSLSQSLLEDVVFGDIACKAASPAFSEKTKVQTASESPESGKWDFPDWTILINPAFESSRYEALHQAAMLPPNCSWGERSRPRLITLTADNDSATGTFFPIARWVATVFEGYNELHPDRERAANLNAIGFVDRYRTHRLKKCKVGGQDTVVMAQDFVGGNTDPNSPLVVARATPDVIDGHDGFLYSAAEKNLDLSRGLFDFLLSLYLKGQATVSVECDR